ncbi:MAG: hypothetical protein ACTSYI_00580 [Promethearchaeota archaeon]
MEKHMLPSDKADELIFQYMRLLNDPKPEEEEQIHDEFLALFGNLQSKFPVDSPIGQEITQIFQLVKDWDPLDYWFFELKTLPNLMQNFFENYYQNEGLIPNPEEEERDEEEKPSDESDNIQDRTDEIKGEGKDKEFDEEQQARIDKRIDLLKIRMKTLKEKATVEPPKKEKSKKSTNNIILQAPTIQIPPLTSMSSPELITAPEISPSTPQLTPQSTPSSIPSSADNLPEDDLSTGDLHEELDEGQTREPPTKKPVSKAEIEQMLNSDQKLNGGSSLISHITIQKTGQNIEEIIYQNDTLLQTDLENDLLDEVSADPVKMYQDLLRMRAKLTYFNKKENQISANFHNGLITEQHFDKFKNQNQAEIEKLTEKITNIRSTLKDELTLNNQST